jgi:uncharacterized protein (DUF1810 family)
MKDHSVIHSDRFNLQRFVDAQSEIYESAVRELRAGQKRSHWMWFVFPQLLGLGRSPMAVKYAISGLEEAEAYLKHSLLGERLVECSRLIVDIDGVIIEQILGFPDCWKFRSCMTLFAEADCADSIFDEAIKKFYDGVRDEKTLELLAG